MLDQIKAEREQQIREIVDSSARRIAILSRTAGKTKALFGHKDRRHRLRRKQKQDATFCLLMEAYTTSWHIMRVMAQPLPRYQEGARRLGNSAIVGEAEFEKIGRAYPVFERHGIAETAAIISLPRGSRVFPVFDPPHPTPYLGPDASKGAADLGAAIDKLILADIVTAAGTR